MKMPKTVKGYLKMLIQIANDSSCDLKGVDDIHSDESRFIGIIRAGIQNNLGEDEFGVMKKYNLNTNCEHDYEKITKYCYKCKKCGKTGYSIIHG